MMMSCESRLSLDSCQLRNKFLRLKTESLLTDVVLTCHDNSTVTRDVHTVNAHKCILSASSAFFKNLFIGSRPTRGTSITDLSEYTENPAVLDGVVEFMYSGFITLTSSTVAEVVCLAARLAIVDLVHICKKYIDDCVNEDNCLALYLDLYKINDKCQLYNGAGNNTGMMIECIVNTVRNMVLNMWKTSSILQERLLKVEPSVMQHLLSTGLTRNTGMRDMLQFINKWIQSHNTAAAYKVVESFIELLWTDSQMAVKNAAADIKHLEHDIIKTIAEITSHKSDLITKIKQLLSTECGLPNFTDTRADIAYGRGDILKDKPADNQHDVDQEDHYDSDTDDLESIGEAGVEVEAVKKIKSEILLEVAGDKVIGLKTISSETDVKETVRGNLKTRRLKELKGKINRAKHKRTFVRDRYGKKMKSSRNLREKTDNIKESADKVVKDSKNVVDINKDHDNVVDYCEKLINGTTESRTMQENKIEQKLDDKPNSFHCRFCNKIFDKEKGLERHIDTHKEKTEECVICKQMFARPYHVVVHIMKVHKDVTHHKCSVCHEIIKHPKNIVKHAKKHRQVDKFSKKVKFVNPKPSVQFTLTSDGKKQFKCNLCEKTFTRKAGYQKHMLIHTGENPFKCQECNMSFKVKYKLSWHVDRVHLGKEIKEYKCAKCNFRFCDTRNYEKHIEKCEGKKIECDICKKKFLYRVELDRHIISHSDIRTHACDKCPRQFKHVQNLKAHVMLKHQNIDKVTSPSVCDHCGKVLKNRNCLRRHLLTHTEDRPYKCTLCPKSYTQSTGLEVHMRLHTGERPYQCEICSQMFVIKCNLDRHIQRHLGEKPHKCDKCDKAFVQITDLRRHKTAVHLAEKSFPCSYCGKKFALKKSVPIHERSHTGEKPFECPSCMKRFTTRSDMKRHEKIHIKDKFRERTNRPLPIRQDQMVDVNTNRNMVTMNYGESFQMVDRMGFQTTCMVRNDVQPPQNTGSFMSAFSTGLGFY